MLFWYNIGLLLVNVIILIGLLVNVIILIG